MSLYWKLFLINLTFLSVLFIFTLCKYSKITPKILVRDAAIILSLSFLMTEMGMCRTGQGSIFCHPDYSLGKISEKMRNGEIKFQEFPFQKQNATSP